MAFVDRAVSVIAHGGTVLPIGSESPVGRELITRVRRAHRVWESPDPDGHGDRAREKPTRCGLDDPGRTGSALPHSSNTTSVPFVTRLATLAASQFVSRTHPWDAA
jgi:hypothetical protein